MTRFQARDALDLDDSDTCHQQIVSQVMVANLKDVTNSWLLQADGSYARLRPGDDEPFSAHTYFMTNPSLSGRGSALRKKGVRGLHLARASEPLPA